MRITYSALKVAAFVSVFALTSIQVSGQTTTLINPATGGGFELGTTFIANGWTEINHTNHQWFVGAPGMATGANGAYISMDAGATNSYSNTLSQTSHFYQDVTVPAGQTVILLSFDLRDVGEAGWDRLLVYTAPTTLTPVAGTPASNSTVLAGATLVYTDPANQAAFTNRQVQLPAALAGTSFRLIFTWQNDNTIGTNPPASVDNISLISMVPAPLNGVYTIDNTQPTSPTIPVPGNFNSFTDAITYLNLNGIAGAVTFNVVAGQTFTESPRNITMTGTAGMPIIFQRNGVGANPVFVPTAGSGATDAAITITGGDYITFNGINIQENAANTTTVMQMEYGYLVRNASATNGANNNTIMNCKITMNRTNVGTRGILQSASTTGGGFTPTSLAGSNATNSYQNDTVTNSYTGIYLLGNTTYMDLTCVMSGCVIGSTAANDIGNGTSQTWGLRAQNQNNVSINRNLVRNVTSTTTTDGILVETNQGIAMISNNVIMALRNSSTTSLVAVSGIRASLSGTGSNQTRIFNNMISNITSAYTGVASATRNLRGINILTGGTATSTHNVHFNSVCIDGSGSPNSSSVCFEVGTTTGPVMNVRSNIFANITGAQTGVAGHYAFASVSATLVGNTGSVSNYNDLYIADINNGYVGRGAATNYATLANWQTAMTQDANSVNADPQFINNVSNLHTYSVNVNGLADMTGITWIATDIDNQTRNVPHDIGADDFTPPTIDMGATLLVTPLTTGCHSASEAVVVQIRNYASLPIDFSANNTTVTVNITGAITQTLTYTLNNNSLNAGNPLAPSATLNIPMGNINMTTTGTYTFNAFTTVAGDGVAINDAMPQVNILVSGGSYVATNGGEICLGSSTNLILTNYTNGGTIQWEQSSDNITWNTIAGATTSPYNITPTDTIYYRAVICGMHTSTVDTIFPEFVAPPTTVNDTICGFGNVTLGASGSGTLNWYDAPTGGNMVFSGTSYTTAIAATDTFYVENTSGTPPSIQVVTFAAGNGSSGNMFAITAINTITITGFDGHVTTGTSDWRIDYRPDNYLLVPGANTSSVGWIPLGTATAVPSGGTGNPTPIPIPFSVTIPAGQTYSFHVMTTAGTGVQYTNGTAAGNVYAPASNSDFQFLEGHGGTSFNCTFVPRIFNGRIHFSAGCGSTRTMVMGVITTAPTVSVTSSNDVCGSGSSTLVVSSSNPAYDYTWTPSATLNTATGDTVIASPTVSTTYIVTGLDSATGCTDSASVAVGVYLNPTGTATVSNDTVCVGTTVTLDVTLGNPNIIVGTNQVQNTTTTYPAPYGNWYWGARHQFLITAADLTAAGLTAGPIDAMSLQVTTLTATALQGFTIQMGQTNATTLTAFLTVPMTTVYTAASYTPVLGLNQHVFSTMFVWDGVSNLVIETCFNNTSFTNNCAFAQTVTTYNSSIWYRADAAGVCGNSAIIGTATQRPRIQFRRAFPYDFTWNPSALMSNPNIQNPTSVVPGPTNYVVTITDSTSGCAILDTVAVATLATPNPSFGPDTVICSNTVLVLDGTAGPHTYLWQDSTTNQTYNANAFGYYSVVATDTVTGCTGSDTILVGVNSAPVFTLGADATACSGTQVSFSGPSGQYSYVWNTGDTVVTITIGTGGPYILDVTDTINGCIASDTVLFNENPLPPVALGNDTSICSASGSLTLSAPAGNFTYDWSTMDSTQTIAVNSTGNYSVLVTDTTTGCYKSDTIIVAYNLSPAPALGNDTTFCSANGPITLVGPAGPYAYVWSDMSAGMTLQTNATGTYYVDVTDTTSGCMASDTIMVTVPATPAVTLNDTAICGTQVTLNGPAGPYSYMWSDSTNAQSTTATTSGTYSLVVTDTTSGCAGSDSAIVNINTNPIVTASASSMTPCADDANVILTGTPTGGTFTGSSVTGNQFDPSIGAGSYVIVYNYTDVNGCSGSDSVTISVNACVGINEPFVNSGMNVYPNPNNGVFVFTAADQNCEHMTIEIITVEGQVISSQQFESVQGNFVQEIDMNDFANGTYIMRVVTDGAVYTQRIVKQD